MTTELMNVKTTVVPVELQEKVLLGGDLSRLTPQERLSYYSAVCSSVGLNPLTRPFEYIVLNGKLQLYARKDCTDQLRSMRNVSLKIVSRELIDGIFVVTSQAFDTAGRTDESIGAVFIGGLQGADKANAIMKAETKAKRRVTLSFCGLGILDESEIADVHQAKFPDAGNNAHDAKPSSNSLRDKIRQRASEIEDTSGANENHGAQTDADVIEREVQKDPHDPPALLVETEIYDPGLPEPKPSRESLVAEAKNLVKLFTSTGKGASLLREIRQHLKVPAQQVIPADDVVLAMFTMLLKRDKAKL